MFRQTHFNQIDAGTECIITYTGNTVGDIKSFQTLTPIECAISNARHAVRDLDAC